MSPPRRRATGRMVGLTCALVAGLSLPASDATAASAVQATPESLNRLAARHLALAQRTAVGDRALALDQRRWCAPHPAGQAHDRRDVAQVESDYRHAVQSQVVPSADRLRRLVVERACAAHRAAQAPQAQRHVPWVGTQLRIAGVRLLADRSGGPPRWEVTARARTTEGPLQGVRMTFSQGLHMACFGHTDASGAVRCILQDTHPHGPGNARVDALAHAGPLIVTLAGRVAPDRVELPTVQEAPFPAPLHGSFAGPRAAQIDASFMALRSDGPILTPDLRKQAP